MQLHELATHLNCPLPRQDGPIRSAQIDSRAVMPGDVFFAFDGEQVNGADFIHAAAKQGAIAAVSATPCEAPIPVLVVPDVHQALICAALAHREQLTCDFIAVTGSCGKTTTRELLKCVFGQAGPTTASIKSYNNNIGVPLTLLSVAQTDRFAVIEIGTSQFGEIKQLSDWVKPNVAMITNAAGAHLEGLGSVAGCRP